ncbi:Cof-type HAD-IIB family hydrolase [Ligilactobacillus sp. WILCCON 0076]|uniref:Cof-type HAD-IIB family hydrolase n=1 Tax=Ligilactobacillus ubinensis TaxID=2876789 RepID=A0A9X2FJ55_9LACO|nr:Cof-type HAD-IIB family hydrolase [Ligilactobacillus ubinensis]MCP0886329.1 Cof-type HAD-IIB family hydrolase [Ligilactobacillus ubinensis]
MIQIIASDMDGTLLNDEMVISDYNAKAIKQAQSQGVHFIISTGRAINEIKPLLDKVNISCPMITINGAQMYDENGKLTKTVALTDQLANKICSTLKKSGLYFELVTTTGVYSDNKAKRIANFAELLSRVSPDTPYKLAVTLASARMELMNINYVDDYFTLINDPHMSILKIVAFSQEGPKVLNPLREEISKNPALKVTASSDSNIEINSINAQKGIALQSFADSLNIPLDNVMAIGDNNNDVSMLKVAGISYAMSNGSIEVKRLANRLAKNNTEDGVGKAIEEILQENN